MISGYCSYCGYSYIKMRCFICGKELGICGCEFLAACEEHYCIECDEIKDNLDGDGICLDCTKEMELINETE